MNSSGTSTVSRSTGSCTAPSTTRVSTCGLPTVSSKPSRRIISTSTASCSSPRPCTSHVSGRSVGSTRMLTLPTSSASRRFFTRRAVSSVAVAAGERRRVDADRHRQARLVDRDHRQRAGVVGIGERLADRDLGDAGDGDDLARAGLVGRHPVERLGGVQLGDAGPLDRAVGAAPRDGLALAQRARAHAAQRQAPDVRRGVEVRHERLQRHVGVVRRRRDALEQQVEQRVAAWRRRAGRRRRPGAPSTPCPRATRSRRSGSRAGRRRRRGRGTAPRRRARPRRCGRRDGRPC